MEIVSIQESEKQATAILTNSDVKAINAAVKLYQHRNDEGDSHYKVLLDVEDKLHELFVKFNP